MSNIFLSLDGKKNLTEASTSIFMNSYRQLCFGFWLAVIIKIKTAPGLSICTASSFSFSKSRTCSPTCSTNCATGSYSLTGATSCSSCSNGKTVASETVSDCTNCVGGQSSEAAGSTSCSYCPLLKYPHGMCAYRVEKIYSYGRSPTCYNCSDCSVGKYFCANIYKAGAYTFKEGFTAVSAIMSLCLIVSKRSKEGAKGLMLLWVSSALVSTTIAVELPQDNRWPAFSFNHSTTPIIAEHKKQAQSSIIANKAIARRVALVNVATEGTLKSALINGNTIVITENIILTNSIEISSGTLTVSKPFRFFLFFSKL